MRNQSKQAGFTLIELLLYVAIVGTLLISLSGFFALSGSSRIKNQSISEVNEQGLAAIEYISQTIRNASSVTSPAAGASASAATLVVPTGALSPTIFDLSSGVLRVKEGAGAAVPLTNGLVQVTSLTFSNLSRPSTDGVVQISITVSRVNSGGRNEYDYTKTFTTSAALR